VAKTLGALIEYLDRLRGQAPLAELTAELAELTVARGEVAEFVRFSDRHYARNLVRGGP
jgi:hypothetical protein